MAQLAEIQTAQRSLEECFMKKMGELEAQLHGGSTAKDTVAKVAEEFRTFRELVFTMMGLLRKQIAECIRSVDDLETRQRRKTLIFSGIRESDHENCATLILGILHGSMGLQELTTGSIQDCHRLGSSDKGRDRPILVRFATADIKAAVWRSKSRLKGTSISAKEFLTRARQAVFGKARLHFGMRGCWTQDGIVNVKAADGSRHRITCIEELNPLLAKYPKVVSVTTKPAPR